MEPSEGLCWLVRESRGTMQVNGLCPESLWLRSPPSPPLSTPPSQYLSCLSPAQSLSIFSLPTPLALSPNLASSPSLSCSKPLPRSPRPPHRAHLHHEVLVADPLHVLAPLRAHRQRSPRPHGLHRVSVLQQRVAVPSLPRVSCLRRLRTVVRLRVLHHHLCWPHRTPRAASTQAGVSVGAGASTCLRVRPHGARHQRQVVVALRHRRVLRAQHLRGETERERESPVISCAVCSDASDANWMNSDSGGR